MSKIFFFLLLFSFIFSKAQSPEMCKIMESEATAAKYKPTQLKSAPQTAKYDVNFYSIKVTLDPTIQRIEGSVTTYFTANDSALSELVFDLNSALSVDSVIYRDSSISYNQLITNTLAIQLPDPILKGNLDSVKVYYQGTPQNRPFVSPFTTTRNSNGDTVLWTLSEPYGAQDWWPCKNSLTDKADSVEIIVKTPKKYKVASHGDLVSVDSTNTTATYHYITRYPIVAYLVAMAVADYKYYDEYLKVGNDSIFMQYFLYQNNSFAASSNGMEEFMQFFDSLIGPYPFMDEKYGHADFTFGGGIEHQTMSFMGNNGGELKAHELAHQWFGNKITCGSWRDLWLNEGFATYLTALTYEFGAVHSPSFYPTFLEGMENTSLNYPNGSVYQTDTSSIASLFTGLVYSKGAFALHMLRWTIKDSAFFEGVRNFMSDSSLAFGFAKTPQLQAHFENSSGQNLDEFFADWVYGKGYPTFDSYWNQSGNQFELRVEQTQSDTSVSFFDIALPYRLIGPSIDTIVVVFPSLSNQQFFLTINQTIDSIQFDPDNWVLNQDGIITSLNETSIENQIRIYPNPAQEHLNIEIPDYIQIHQIQIFNISGSQLLQTRGVKNIDINALEKGIYIIELQTNKGVYRKKLIKY